MQLTPTEVPTFFGPSDSPLFGVVHLPVDNQIRGGVLICGSLGKEGMDSVRLHRVLAGSLASRGFAVLRFDYLGLGDSAYAQGRDDAVANWVASVGHALDYLTLIGAQSATAIGIRAGCLILNEYLAQSHTVNRVVYLDPYGTGKRYLREHRTLFRLSVGADAATPGEVSIFGGRLSDHAAAEFAALTPAPSRRGQRALAAARGVAVEVDRVGAAVVQRRVGQHADAAPGRLAAQALEDRTPGRIGERSENQVVGGWCSQSITH